MPRFRVTEEKGYEVKQLRRLNKLRYHLDISGLENVKSEEYAHEANLAAKEHLMQLSLDWGPGTRCSPEVEAKILEGLCPPERLVTLDIMGYRGSAYPNWMVYDKNGGRRWKHLQTLEFDNCSQRGPAPQLVKTFPALRVLSFIECSWDALPGNMDELTYLEQLCIYGCMNIKELPTLPRSLKGFTLGACNNEFMMSCQTQGHPNFQKIEHVPTKQLPRSSNAPWPTSDGPASPSE